MFDLRYYIASLAAVFIALAVGIVIGVAIASGNKVPKGTLNLLNGKIARLNNQLDQQEASLRNAHAQLSAATDLLKDVYPDILTGRLQGRSYAVLYLGGKDDAARKGVEEALAAGGAGPPVRSTTLTLPFDAGVLMDLVQKNSSFAGLDDLAAVGHELGLQYASGSDSLWSVVRGELVEEGTGQLTSPVDGVVVVSDWLPESTNDPAAKLRNDEAAQLVAGMLNGLEDSGLKVVGVESYKGDGKPSTLAGFEGLSTVNDVDLLPGTVALGLLLATDAVGHYGVSAPDGVVPDLSPLLVAQTPAGAG
jgi:hypothetical protein